MNPTLLIVTYELRIPVEAFLERVPQAARSIAEASGLLWKTALIETCEATDVAFWLPGGQILAGWAAVEAGDPAGLSLIRRGMTTWQEQQINLTRPYSLAVLAQASQRCGSVAEAHAALSEAQRLVDATGERWHAVKIDLPMMSGG